MLVACTNNPSKALSGPPNTTSIVLGNGSEAAVTDYSASVKVYYSDNRLSNSQKLTQNYKMSSKIIDGSVYARVDYAADTAKGIAAKSVIAGPEETVVFNPESGVIEQRQPSIVARNAEGALPKARTLFNKIDVVAFSESYRNLGYDVFTEKMPEDVVRIVINSPKTLLPKTSNQKAATQSFKVFLDPENGTLAGTEQVELEEDGTKITTTVTNYFLEKEGISVPVGSLTQIAYDEPYTIDTSDSNLPPMPDPATLPVISKEELAELKKTSSVYEPAHAVIGDPSDPDHTESWVTVYETVETNHLTESDFRVPGGR